MKFMTLLDYLKQVIEQLGGGKTMSVDRLKMELEYILNFPEVAPFKNPKTVDYTMIDLFAGIGGIQLGNPTFLEKFSQDFKGFRHKDN